MNQEARNAMAAGYCGRLKSFVTSLNANTAQLRNSIGQKPPTYADLSSFLLNFNDRVAEDSAEVDLLGEMTVENVSFEELLAHCMELYKQTENSIEDLENHLEQFGYTKGETAAEGEQEKHALEVSLVEGLKQRIQANDASPRNSVEAKGALGSQLVELQLHSTPSYAPNSNGIFDTIRSSAARSRALPYVGVFPSPVPFTMPPSKMERDDMSQFDEEFSLENFGISASSLTRLSRPDQGISDRAADRPVSYTKQDTSGQEYFIENGHDDTNESGGPGPPHSPGIKSQSSSPSLSLVTNAEYDQVMPFLKKRVTLEELNDVIVKLNDAFGANHGTTPVATANNDENSLELEESLLLGYGSNMKSCLLILVHISRLLVARRDSGTYYRPS